MQRLSRKKRNFQGKTQTFADFFFFFYNNLDQCSLVHVSSQPQSWYGDIY